MRLSNSSGYYVDLTYTQGNVNQRYTYKIGPYSPRTNFQNRQGRPGSVQMADLQTGHRTISFDYKNYNTSESGFIQQLENINKVFNPSYEPFYLTDTQMARRMQVYLTSQSQTPTRGGLENVVADCSLQFTSPDSYWEATTATTSGLVLNHNETITITNTSAVPVYPTITVTAGVANSTFRLTNETTGLFTQLANSSFTSGSVFVIDAVNGRATLNGTLSNLSLSRGSGFWPLEPGANVIRYRSSFSPVTVSVSYNKLWTN